MKHCLPWGHDVCFGETENWGKFAKAKLSFQLSEQDWECLSTWLLYSAFMSVFSLQCNMQAKVSVEEKSLEKNNHRRLLFSVMIYYSYCFFKATPPKPACPNLFKHWNQEIGKQTAIQDLLAKVSSCQIVWIVFFFIFCFVVGVSGWVWLQRHQVSHETLIRPW